jgi:hypothetical protein
MSTTIAPPQIEIPDFLTHLPTFAGMPVPFTATWYGAKPDFRVVDPNKVALCLRKHLCGVCGRRLGDWCYFIGGPQSKDSKLFNDPPMHIQCARFSSKACAYLNGTRQGYSDRPIPAMTARDENVVPIRPPEMYILRAKTSKVGITNYRGSMYITVPSIYGVEAFS